MCDRVVGTVHFLLPKPIPPKLLHQLQDFVAAMTNCVERVVGTVHAECVQQRLSAKGNYISVTGK